MVDKVLYSSASSEYGTPDYIFEPVRAALGLDFDGAASHENHKLPYYATKDGVFRKNHSTPAHVDREYHDGLTVPWADKRVFLNPPYGVETSVWVRKTVHEKAQVAALLLPARVDTDWFHRWVAPYAEVTFIMGRIKFEGMPSSAPFPSIIAVYSPGLHIAPGEILARRWDPRSGPFESAVSIENSDGRSARSVHHSPRSATR